ncbi:hypothetical protein HDU78_002757 [Chytriomyces hyalinus]|nr:hypothetical protein HDU78_002757 [Chytriomyces hyalinus]
MPSAGFESTLNLRPVGSSNRVFRSAKPGTSRESATELDETLRIASIIDLRGPWEKKKDRIPATDKPAQQLRLSVDLSHNVIGTVLRSLSWRCLWVTLYYALTFRWTMAKRIAVQGSFLNKPGGLTRFYIVLLDNHGNEFNRIFRFLTEKSHFPVLIHCSAGKDRTGILSALIHRLMGTPDADILKDYLLSNKGLESVRTLLENEVDKMGMCVNEFAGCKEEAMIGFLDHLDTRYGGVHLYLESIGVSRAEQDLVRTNLLGV